MSANGIRARLLAFLILSAVGIVYVAASYLGFVDKVLNRGLDIQATLPVSGGLYQGSAVTYRGVKVGKVGKVTPSAEGIKLQLALEDGTKIPLASPMYVHNLSAVGEQYLDFEPISDQGPYAENGDTIAGSMGSIPTDEAELLVELDSFVSSVDKRALRTVVSELGNLFEDTGRPLQRLLDNGGDFIDEANAHTDETIALLDSLQVVLGTQQDNSENIRSFSEDLRLLTGALRESDADIREVLVDTPAATRQLNQLMLDLEPTLPILLGNATSVSQVLVSHLGGLEQLLVTYPRVISSGFTGTTPDGYGHVNLQMDNSVPPCTKGYKPVKDWRRGDELTDAPIFPAKCTAGDPFVQRGTPNVPGTKNNPNPMRTYPGTYDPETGVVTGAVDAEGNPVRLGDPGNLSILGDDSWKWLLVGPVAQ